jgi:hypothetical protein
MMKVAGDFENQQIITQTLPGYSYTDPASGASYWMADSEKAEGILDKLFAGQNFAVNQTPPRSNIAVPAIAKPEQAEASQTESQPADGVDPDEAENLPAEDGAGINDSQKDTAADNMGSGKNDTGKGSQIPQPVPIPDDAVSPPPAAETPVDSIEATDPGTGSAGY